MNLHTLTRHLDAKPMRQRDRMATIDAMVRIPEDFGFHDCREAELIEKHAGAIAWINVNPVASARRDELRRSLEHEGLR